MADGEGRAALRGALGGVEPRGFGDVDDERLAELAAALRRVKQHQREELDRAVTESLELIPRVLRPAVRRALGL